MMWRGPSRLVFRPFRRTCGKTKGLHCNGTTDEAVLAHFHDCAYARVAYPIRERLFLAGVTSRHPHSITPAETPQAVSR